MVPTPGRRGEPPTAGSRLAAFARWVGFTALAAAALVVLAAVVLVPPYARAIEAEYERQCLAERVRYEEAMIAAYDRFIAAAEYDEALNTRLAMSQLGLFPGDEVVVVDRIGPPRPPGLIIPAGQELPQPPSPKLTHAGQRLSDPRTQRGLLVLSAAAMAGAWLLLLARRRPGTGKGGARLGAS